MRRSVSFLAALLVLLSASVLCFAESHSVLPEVRHKPRPDCPELKVYYMSKLAGRAYEYCDDAYMSLSEFGELYGVSIRTNVTDTGFTAVAEGLDIHADADSNYLTVNCRYIFLPDNYLLCEDEVYLPLDALSRIFGVTALAGEGRLDISTKTCRLITGGEDYYKLNMSADYQYWLPRIITIETQDEPLAGKIGVGNVILNRVKSSRYPDSIYKVLYDNNTGVQFAPAITGALKMEGDDDGWLAACLCFEGYNTVGDSFFFANPENDANYWFKTNCILITTIGRHEFYK